MKKFLSVLLAMTLLLACASIGAVAETTVWKIGILAPAATHGWVAGVAFNAQARCEELKAEGKVEYNIVTANNIEEMTAGLDDLMVWGADAVVCFPQWEGMEDPIADAVAAGKVIVNFDIDIAVDGIYKVTGDNYSMGVASAKYIVDKIGPEGIVVAMTVPTAGSVNELRLAGFMDTVAEIAPNLDVREYATEFTREAGLRDMNDILIAEAHIDAVFSMDDETSIGALQAIGEAARDDIKAITGGGGCQEYFNMMPEYETIFVQSALYSPTMVRDAVDVAVKVLEGEEVEQTTIIPSAVVDRDNYTEYLDENSVY